MVPCPAAHRDGNAPSESGEPEPWCQHHTESETGRKRLGRSHDARMADSPTTPASVVTQFRLRAGATREFSRLLGDLNDSLLSDPAFGGGETHLDASGANPTAVWHFSNAEAAKSWSTGPRLRDFEHSLEPYSAAAPVSNVLLETSESGKASTVITTRVLPGNDAWFAEWQGRMGAAQQQFPGYVGQRVQAPVPGVNADWVAIVAFETEADLKHWQDSPERQALVAESTPHVDRYDVRPASSAFESWFAKDERGAKPPPAWKLSAIVLLVLYPIVMLEVFTLNHITKALGMEPALGIFIGNAVSVAITGFLLIPWASSLLNWWLVPPEALARKRTTQGGLLVLVLYAISVFIFAFLIALYPALLP